MYNLFTVTILRFVSIYFILSVIVAAYFYPGGNMHDPLQIGYSFTHNFLSDLGGYYTRSGEVNFLSAFFFNFSMFLFVLVGVGFLFVPWLFKDNSITFYLSILGSFFFFFGTIYFAAVGLTPHDLYLREHIYFAVNAFRLIAPALLIYIIVFFRSSIPNFYSYLTLIFFLFTAGYVIYQLTNGSPRESVEALVEQASIQKLIALVSTLNIFLLSFGFKKKIKELNIS
tara:strand:- start:40 stop:720 length:681 start_codon:yes stop_codon:yes gene_type:complete